MSSATSSSSSSTPPARCGGSTPSGRWWAARARDLYPRPFPLRGEREMESCVVRLLSSSLPLGERQSEGQRPRRARRLRVVLNAQATYLARARPPHPQPFSHGEKGEQAAAPVTPA